MMKKTDSASTPFYVLKNGNQTIHPTIGLEDSHTSCICVYGFSNKQAYDRFIKSSNQLLTPFPLVKGYLANQIADDKASETNDVFSRLVILDASDHVQPVLSAATMAAVLLAQQENKEHVPIELELVFDPETAAYRIKHSIGKTPTSVG